MPGDRRFRVLDDDRGGRDVPGMLVEAAAEHVAEFRPREEGGGSRMRRNETLAVVTDEREQIGALFRSQIDLAHAEEEDGIEVIQVAREELLAGRDAGAGLEVDRVLRDRLRVGPDDR